MSERGIVDVAIIVAWVVILVVVAVYQWVN